MISNNGKNNFEKSLLELISERNTNIQLKNKINEQDTEIKNLKKELNYKINDENYNDIKERHKKLEKIKFMELKIEEEFCKKKATIEEKADNISSALEKYFQRNPLIWNKLIEKKDKGNFLNSIRKEAIKSVSDTLTPAIALAIKMRLKISNRKYKFMCRSLQKTYDFVEKKFKIRKVKGFDIWFPRLLPSLKKVKDLQKSLENLHTFATMDGRRVSLKEFLTKCLQINEFRESLTITDNLLEIKIGGDGFRLSRLIGAVDIYFTLFNLGPVIHSPEFAFLLGIFNISEEYESLKNNTQELISEIEDLSKNGMDINNKHFKIDFFFVQILVLYQNGLG